MPMAPRAQLPVAALLVLSMACESEHADDIVAPTSPTGVVPPDTVAMAVGNYHGVRTWSWSSAIDGPYHGSDELDFSVSKDYETHNANAIDAYGESHIVIRPDLSLTLQGTNCGGRIVLDDSISYWRNTDSQGILTSYTIVAKKIH